MACSGSDISFDLAPASQIFHQNDLVSSDKIDILWVIDNSLSMQSSQDNLRANFDIFLDQFATRNMDFQMAVTTTEAYRYLYTGDNSKTIFRDTNAAGVSSGYKIVTPATPDFRGTMQINLDQGVNGSGDERAFQSFIEALKLPENTGFLRPNSFLAVIILSDEDDFSADSSTSIAPNYSSPLLYPISKYINDLDALTQSDSTMRKYSVSAIAIKDQACLDQLSQTSNGQKIGLRYMDIASQTSGIVSSLCGNFATALNEISGRILELLTGFKLDRIPKPSSIVVYVNGVAIPEDPVNGWTYDSAQNMIVFHGSAVPTRGSIIIVNFQPLDPKR